MPELPEVETVRHILKPQIINHTIVGINIDNHSIISFPDSAQFASNIIGRTIVDMTRRGKFLVLHLDNEDKIVIHLRLTGQLLVIPEGYRYPAYMHLNITLTNHTHLIYADQRGFGRLWYIDKHADINITGINKLGLEPDDVALTGTYLKDKLSNTNRPIKTMLLDQSIVAGIGNIYSDEILYKLGIHPQKKCKSITDEEWNLLAKTIKNIMQWAVKVNATMSQEEYLLAQALYYKTTPFLKAYGHASSTCEICGETFKRVVINGRGSCFCPKCQRL